MNKPLVTISGSCSGISGGISARPIANLARFACQMPRRLLIIEMMVMPARQEY